MEAQTQRPPDKLDAYVQLGNGLYVQKSSPALVAMLNAYRAQQARARAARAKYKAKKYAGFKVVGFKMEN